MQRVRHFWRKVPEISRAGSKNAAAGVGSNARQAQTELHRLVDADQSLPAAAILLRRAPGPVAAKLDAPPYEDEELTDEDLRAAKEARSEPGLSLLNVEAE